MRLIIDIDDQLLVQAKKRAADEGVALRDVIEAALRVYLGQRPRSSVYRLRWRTERGRLLAGVDLDNRESLFDRMDRRC